jgi:phosphoheptose isomerase
MARLLACKLYISALFCKKMILSTMILSKKMQGKCMMNEQEILNELMHGHPELVGLQNALCRAVDLICESHRADRKVLLCGNGGSAADCAHIVGELGKGFLRRRSMPEEQRRLEKTLGADEAAVFKCLQGGVCAVNLCDATALLTAVANDLSGEMIFAQQVFSMGRPGDVLVGLTTSGSSMNVVRAMQVAKAREMKVIGFRGENPGRIDEYCDVLLHVPGASTHAVQELHLPLYHALCALVESRLFPE